MGGDTSVMTTMIHLPQRTIDSTLHDAVADGCDIVQPKLTGIWCKVAVSQNRAVVYNSFGDQIHTFTVDKPVCSILIGSFFGPPRLDCKPHIAVEVDGVVQDLSKYTYRNRFAFLKLEVSNINHPDLHLVKNYPIAMSQEIWDTPPAHCNGLVFRRSKDPVDVRLRVTRMYENIPRQLV
jgi:hypothetical protein